MIEIIKKMQKEVSERSPKYGMRKLSVGLVSCFLGYAIMSSPTIVNAQVIEGTSADSELRYIQEDIQRHKTNTVVSNSTDNEVMNKDNVNNTRVIENSRSIKPNPAPKLGNRNVVTNSNYSMDGPGNLGNRDLEISDDDISSPVKASQNNKVEKIVTDETKTSYNKDSVGDIDNTVLDSEGNFIGKEDGSVSISGNKDIASKEDFDKEKTVDEFNEKTRAEKEAEYRAEIDKNNKRIEDINKAIKERNQVRESDLINNFEKTFKNDLVELEKYDKFALVFSHNIKYDKNVKYELIKNFNWNHYYFIEDRYFTVSGPGEEEYNSFKSAAHIFSNGSFATDTDWFRFIYKKPSYGGSKELDDYVKNSNLYKRLNDFFSNYRDQYYALDKNYYDDSYKESTEIEEKNRKLEKNLYFNKNNFYAKIKEDNLRSNEIEIIKDPTIWEGSFRWERYSKDGYIKTLIQNDKEVAKRVQHPLSGIKRVGTKTEEVRERRETESSTYDVVERPTADKDENGKVVQEGSDGLVEKVYDATYDKFSNVIKKELKDTTVKKEKKDRIVLRYGIKEETKTPVTLYDGIKNYDTDEKKIKDYSESERYRTTDLQPGNVNQDFGRNDERVEKEGFKFTLSNPSADSPSKTEYGWQITIDKEKGQRTYTNIAVTDGGAVPVPTGEKPMMKPGEKLTPKSTEVNFGPSESGKVDSSSRQRNYNYIASEETLKYINSNDNPLTSFGMKDNYTQDNPRIKFFANNFALDYKVNPWPNENDKLELLKLNGTYDKKEYVKGQEIRTDIRISNLDENAKERIVGQVYNPATGDIVKEANTYIGDDGYIYIKMPEGVINEDGTQNKDSIFNTPEYKGLQNLDVKFFARPRTKDEFKRVAASGEDEYGNPVEGTYTGTGAGSKFINHKGKEVEIDLQGIDRYDHYNLIGSFKLQLDDTRYYDQNFIGSDKEDTSKHTSIPILPGQDFTAKVYLPEDKKDNPYQKSDLDIKDDAKKAVLYGKLDKKFIEKYNQDKKDADKWVIKDDDITKFTITPPKTAKPGDFMAIPIEYTYTNGSKDVHWFHFVVQGSVNNVPSYKTKVGYQGDKLVSDINISDSEEDMKKNQPLSYELADDEYIDSQGNRWTNIEINPKTGQVTATVPKGVKIDGGEILTVGVKVNYKDKYGIEKQEIVKAEFVARPKYDGKFEYTEYEVLPYDTEVKFDNTLKAGEKKVIQEGKEGSKKRTITQEYQNEKLLDQVVGEWKTEKEPTKRIIAVGSMTDGVHEYVEKVPFKYTVVEDTGMKKGTYKIEVAGEYGEKTTKLNIVNSKVVGKPYTEQTKDPVDAVIKVGKGDLNGTKTIEDFDTVEYETKIEFDDTLKVGEEKVTQDGKLGKKKRNITLTIVNGEVTNTDMGDYEEIEAPVNKIVKVGTMTEGTHSHTEKIPFKTTVEVNPSLKKGEWRYKKLDGVEQKGVEGTKTTTWTIKNSKIVDKKEDTVKEVDAIIEVGSGDFTGSVSHQVTEEKAFNVEIVEDSDMPSGTHEIIQNGVPGEVVTEYSQKIKNGEAIGDMKSKEISNKKPINQIIKVGTKPAKNNKDIDNNTNVTVEYVYDNSLDKGIVKTGELTKGNVKTEIVNEYNPKTGKIETKEKTVVTDAVQKIIVGTKDYIGEFKHTEVQKTEYDTEIIFDNTLKEGESVITQKGELGEKTREITQTFTNGEIGEKKVSEYKETKTPVKQIIKVGSMTDGEHSYTEKIPFNYTVNEVDTLKKGEYEVVTPGTAGTKITKWKIKNSKIVEDPIVEATDPVNAVINVGKGTNNGTHEITETEVIPFDTVVEFDDSLAPGEQKVAQEGSNGEKQRTTTLTIQDGNVTNTEIGEYTETTKPINKIIKVGRNTDGTHTYTNKKPFDVEVRVNPNLAKGEYNVIQEGVEGEEEVTFTIEDSKVTETSGPKETKAPVNKIIEVGSKDYTGEVKHTEHFEIPFEVEVRYNNELPAGTSREIQNGEKGSYDVEYKQAIKNGQADGELTKTESNRTEAKKHIIEVGTKVETPEKTYSKDVEVEIEYVYDDTKDKGVVETGELTSGKVETKVVDRYDPETGKIKQTAEEVVTKAKQKIIVGTKDFTGKYEYENTCPIPFDVEVKEDDTLKKGEKKVLQVGVPGKKYHKYSQNIVNGQPDGDRKLVEEKVTKNPVKEIILVGTGKNTGEATKTIERDIPFDTNYIYDDTLDSGTSVVEKEGKLGKEQVTITTTIVDGEGTTTEKVEKVSDKEDRVVRIGIKPIERKIETGFNTIYHHNAELKDGELKTITEGSNGQVITTIFYNKESGRLETQEKRVEPTDKVVEYGSKTEGEIRFKSNTEFGVKVIKDENLKTGEVVVDREGIPGTKETVITIENSQEVDRSEKIIKEPVDKIIRIGIKCDPNDVCPACPTPETPKEPEKPENPPTPEKPEDPSTPENPPIPETPKEPEKPEVPEDSKIPEVPDVPEVPEIPQIPKVPEYKETSKVSKYKETPSPKKDKDNISVFSTLGSRIVEEKPSIDKIAEVPEEKKQSGGKNDDIVEETVEEKKKNIDTEEKPIMNTSEVKKKKISDFKRAPKTGDPGIKMYVASSAASLGLLGILRRRKKNENSNKNEEDEDN